MIIFIALPLSLILFLTHSLTVTVSLFLSVCFSRKPFPFPEKEKGKCKKFSNCKAIPFSVAFKENDKILLAHFQILETLGAMHGYSRLGMSSSPPTSPRFRHGRNKLSAAVSGGGGGRSSKKKSLVERVVFVLVSAVFRRRGVLLFAPLLYISGMLLYMGSLGFDVVNLKQSVVGVVVHNSKYSKRFSTATPGSIYRSPQVFEKLWPFMERKSNGSVNAVPFCYSVLKFRYVCLNLEYIGISLVWKRMRFFFLIVFFYISNALCGFFVVWNRSYKWL